MKYRELLIRDVTGRYQLVGEEVCGVGVVVGVSTWTLSSWIGPPNGFVEKSYRTTQQSTSCDTTVTATAKSMVVQAQ
jgi:hypothetical protein